MPVVLAQSCEGAAMFTRSTPGCRTLDGPSLAWAASLWPKLRSSDGSPGLRLPSADGQLSRLASDLRMVYAQYIYGIYHEYTLYILSDSKSCILSAIEWLSWNAMLHTCIYNSSNIDCFFESWQNFKITKPGICMAYAMHILGICHVYTRYFWYEPLKENYAS